MKRKLLVLSILAASTLGFAKYGWDAKTLVHLGTGFNPNSLHPNISVSFYKELESKSKIGFKIGGGIELGYSHYFHKEEEKKQEESSNSNQEQPNSENGSAGSGEASNSDSGSESSSDGASSEDASTNPGSETGSPSTTHSNSEEPSSSETADNKKDEEKKNEENPKLPNHGYGVGFASVELFGNVHEDVMIYGGGSIGYNFMFKNAEERNKFDNQLYVKGFAGITYKEIYTAEISYGSTNGLALGLGARIGF